MTDYNENLLDLVDKNIAHVDVVLNLANLYTQLIDAYTLLSNNNLNTIAFKLYLKATGGTLRKSSSSILYLDGYGFCKRIAIQYDIYRTCINDSRL